MKKILFIILFLSTGIMYAMEDKQLHLKTFRNHCFYAEALCSSMTDQLFNNTVTIEMRRNAYPNIVQAITQLKVDIEIADDLMLTKIRIEMGRMVERLEELRNAIISYKSNNQTPPLPFNL